MSESSLFLLVFTVLGRHANQVIFAAGEGRCPVVPLVFKTGERLFR
jgi:hypothetical protein